MRISIIGASLCWMAATACVPAADESPAQDHDVVGRVHGLWDGADGVVLRLHSDGVDVLRTVATNGAFRFDAAIAAGSSYTVTVGKSPAQHDCVVEQGGSAVVANASAPSVSIACKGPDVAIALSGGWGWSFDPTQETQTFAGPLGAHDVALTVTGTAAMRASIAGKIVTLGEPTAPIALALGAQTVAVSVEAGGGLSKSYDLLFERAASLVAQVAYGKASNPDATDQFGFTISLSGDTLAVGAPGEASNAKGINGNQANNSASFSGAVYVFVRSGTSWSQQAYLKASNTESTDEFGISVSLSGNTLAVGAPLEDSGSASNQNNNAVADAGAAYVFVRNGTTWSQQAYLKASSIGAFDAFGTSVALTGDTLAVGAPGEPIDVGALRPGAVYVFQRSGTRWTQQAALHASNPDARDQFGQALALSGDTLAVGAPGEDSAATGVNGNQSDNSVSGAGAVYVFQQSGQTWAQQAYVKASNTMGNPPSDGPAFGVSISLSSDTLAVGSNLEWGGTLHSGAVYVFTRSGTTWSQQAYLKASNINASDHFGDTVVVSGDQLLVGATLEDSIATGINGNQSDNTALSAGAAYLFTRSAGVWTQQAYLKASNTGPAIVDTVGGRPPLNDQFGRGLALSGTTLVVGAALEFGGSAGFNGNQADNSKRRAGAIYIFQQ